MLHQSSSLRTIKGEVQKQRVSIEHVSTNFMIADPLTKGLNPNIFSEHVESMGIIGYLY